jgi:hypothetical protein
MLHQNADSGAPNDGKKIMNTVAVAEENKREEIRD